MNSTNKFSSLNEHTSSFGQPGLRWSAMSSAVSLIPVKYLEEHWDDKTGNDYGGDNDGDDGGDHDGDNDGDGGEEVTRCQGQY